MSGYALTGIPALLAIPLGAAILLALTPDIRRARALNIAASALGLLCALGLIPRAGETSVLFLTDRLNIVFLILNAFVGLTSSVFSAGYIGHEVATGRLNRPALRLYHAMFQLMLFAMNLALAANNIGLIWVAVELATLSTVMMVGIYRTHEALEAAWKYFILGSLGIGLALFGTILVYLAASEALGEGLAAMEWSRLAASARLLDPRLLSIAFAFLLVGYGTKCGLVPMHAWLPDAHAEGPTPVSAVLSGLLLNVALYALLRFKMILAARPGAIPPAPLMILFGLGSVLFAALMLYRRGDIKRLFAYSSIEQMGLITFAFGMGGPIANLAGILQMILHSLVKSAIFFSVGQIVQSRGTQKIAEIRGLTASHPLLGWMLVAGVIAIAGLPPFGIFTSEFLLLTSSFARAPLLALSAAGGLLLAFGALLWRMQGMAFGRPHGSAEPVRASYLPAAAHLAIALALGLILPGAMLGWLQAIAERLG
ncbi:hydrogenase 4 subunit F [Acidisoma sp. C75]